MARVELTEALLRATPLPGNAEGDDKDARGAVPCVGGGAEVPGGILLAAGAALRAGGGKPQVAAARSVAAGLALAIPKARVTPLDETAAGEIEPAEGARIARRLGRCAAGVLGPGMLDEEGAGALEGAAEPRARLVIDAAALAGLRPLHAPPLAGRVAITPHAGEMARLLGVSRERVEADRRGAARGAPVRWWR